MNPLLMERPLEDIKDTALLQLMEELGDATGEYAQTSLKLPFRGYLVRCLHPGGKDKKVRISSGRLTGQGNLTKKVGKLRGTGIYQVCDELARRYGTSVELYETHQLFTFLNKIVPDQRKRNRVMNW